MMVDESLACSQNSSSLGEFAEGIAHDLQALLLPIAEHVLALCAEGYGDRAAQGRLQQIYDTVELARDLVHQVSSHSRGPVCGRRLLSLGSVVSGSLPLMRAIIASGTLLRVAIDAKAPLVDIDPIALRRVLLNLVMNAARAIRRPHGVIEIGVAGMRAADGLQFARLTVADNGRGMDAATLDRLRQRLVEWPGPPGGGGMGLRIVQGAVCAHRGRLLLESQLGDGTTVRIDLPQAQREPTIQVPDPCGDRERQASKRGST